MKSTVVASHELKGLETRLIKAKSDLEQERQLAAEQKKKANEAENKVNRVEQQVSLLVKMINSLKEQSVEPIVSEHAILRWLQHVHGINLDEIRKEILNEKTRESIMFARNGKFTRHEEGVKIVFENKTIVTIVKED